MSDDNGYSDDINELPRSVDADDGMTDFGDDSAPLPGTVIGNFGKLRKSRSCKMCVHDDCGQWEEKITDGNTTQKNAAKEMGLTDQVVSDHMRNHFAGLVLDGLAKSPMVAQTVISLEGATAMLKGILDKLLLRSTTVLGMPIDPKSEFAVKANISEIREVTKLIMEMHGMLQPATQKIHAEQVNIQYNVLQEAVITELCPICRPKVINKLQLVKF